MRGSTEKYRGPRRSCRRERQHRPRLLVFVFMLVFVFGMAALVTGCAQPHDLPTERCLDVLAYRVPEHGKIGEIHTGKAPSNRSVIISYAGGKKSPREPLQSITCEYSADEPWTVERVAVGDRALTERELALVNADLLLRDLSLRPQRFEERPAQATPQPTPMDGDVPPPARIGSARPTPTAPR